ncbi:hypothetical protein MGYG_07613 [Nannizzia gypsea CBS 118893]|uniref:DUF1308 domain-containing protein n=1 Tax=Arthroderma gypseum (strain ATCC MYA-4604 / CBS 118893) TaxID=535722 RepID=E4V3N2_ARTGP|nr:hypothetical protein MGYG_07613 [Nannizzia gypsea CBS 118893]EFR04606.1 hypothetical protein MGYG_07613 [Nannizzia gypsea CBS 118893]
MENLTAMKPQSPVNRPQNSQELASSLLEECNKLLSEISSFQAYLVALGKPNLVELRQFKSIVQSELKSLQRLAARADEAAAEDAEDASRVQQDKTDIRIQGQASGNEEDGEYSDEEYLGQAESKVVHSLRSSNFPFYANVWRTAKTSCTGLISLNKKFYFYKPEKDRGTQRDYKDLEADIAELRIEPRFKPGAEEATPKMRKRGVLIDIVADNGEEWVKVSTVTPNRLLFDLAKQGWEIGLNSGSEDDDDGSNVASISGIDAYDSEDEDDMIELLKLAVDMKKAAAEVRVRYKHPRVRLVLPKIVEGQVAEIDKIIRKVRTVGVTVECGTAETSGLDFVVNRNEPVNKAIDDAATMFSSLLPSPFPPMTSTLNVDCTLLLAFVSDLSHARDLECMPSYHPAINRQIELEAEKPLLLSELWPAAGDRNLVCTTRAAKRMREIVETIGTPREKERTRLLMGEAEDVPDRETLISKFQNLSDYTIPLDWKLPIKVVDAQSDIDRGWKDGSLPFIARKIAQNLSDINRSVFLYGWAAELTTISSNRTVVKQIETWIEEQRGDDDEVCGPTVWVCDTARSLIGKDSSRAI